MKKSVDFYNAINNMGVAGGVPAKKYGGRCFPVAFSRDERIKDLVNLIESPDEQAYVGSDGLDEMEIYDMEMSDEVEDEFYEEDGEIE